MTPKKKQFHSAHERTLRHYRHWLRSLRKGMMVSAHYDGKGGRAVDAQVIKAKRGVVIAEFERWAGEGRARVRFVDGGGWDAGGESMPAVLGLLGCRARRRGDWYSLGPHRPAREGAGAAAVVRACRAAAERSRMRWRDCGGGPSTAADVDRGGGRADRGE